METNIIENSECEALTQRTILLAIPPRLQWENNHGYCGETTIQAFGMCIVTRNSLI